MNTYLSIMAKYANMRAFEKPNEGAAGGAGDESEKTAAAETAAAEAAKAAAEAVKAAAADSEDPKLKAAAAEKAELLREVMDKKEKLKSTSKDLADAKKALDAYEGVDAAKVKELVKKETDAAARDAEARGDFDRVRAMMVAEHEKAMKLIQDDLEAERVGRKADLSLIDELTIGNAFGNSNFIRENLNISTAKVRALYGAHFDRQDGAVVAYDKPAGEKGRTLLVNAKGQPLAFEEALERIVEADPEKKGLLKSRAKQGSGSASDLDKGKNAKPVLTGAARISANLAQLDE